MSEITDLRLLNKQKNEILKIVNKNNLSPKYFTWQNIEYSTGNSLGMVSEYICSKIYFKEGYYFTFNFDGFSYNPVYSPGEGKRTESFSVRSWSGLINTFNNWLENLKHEVDEPDLWVNLDKYKPTIGVDFDGDGEEKFSYEDVQNIKTQLDYIKNRLNESFALNETHNKHVDNQLEYLIETAKHQNIRDWRNIAIATFINIAATLTISSDKMPLYWQIISDGFKQVRHLLGI